MPLACLLEVTAPKAGNVHPGAAFADMSFEHFAASAVVVGESLAGSGNAANWSVGKSVLLAVQATRRAVPCNTNLGTVLLFAPLVAAIKRVQNVDDARSLLREIARTLRQLDDQDAVDVYEAIRLAQPGGLGEQAERDVAAAAPRDLIAAMRQVSAMDAVARQYSSDFADLFERTLPWLAEELSEGHGASEAICRLQIRWLAYEPDGLIVRKLGVQAASLVQRMAQQIQSEMQREALPLSELASYQEFDQYLRGDGNRRNPGTTADLIAATLLVTLCYSPNCFL